MPHEYFFLLFSIFSLTSGHSLLLFDLTIFLEWELFFISSALMEFTLFLFFIYLFFFYWMSLLSFVYLIPSMVLFYSGEYMIENPNINRCLYLVLAFVFSMSMMIYSPNFISILLGWDGLGLISYILVIYYQNEKSASSGMITILSNFIGDVPALLSIAIFMSLGSWNSIFYTPLISDEYLLLKCLMILTASPKSAQMPFSAWLPAAMAAHTPVSALVHSSTLVAAGVYLLIRFIPTIVNFASQSPLFLLAAQTMFMAGLVANFEYDLKKIIALSTLSQLGVMISILALGFAALDFFSPSYTCFVESLAFSMCSNYYS